MSKKCPRKKGPPFTGACASGSGSGLYTVVVDGRLSGNKRGKSVVTVRFLAASLLGSLFSDMVRDFPLELLHWWQRTFGRA